MTLPALLLLLLATAGDLREAIADLQRGDFTGAEKLLRIEVTAHPRDALALSLLGAALDNQQRPAEADAWHRKAVAAARNVDTLNNLAAHLMLSGNAAEALKVYREVLALDSGQINANLQLAQLALASGGAREALDALQRLPEPQRLIPQVLLLRLEAAYSAGDLAQGDAIAAQLMESPDGKLAIGAGLAVSRAKRYAQAEKFFEAALRHDPVDFTLLANLGAAAAAAGHGARAREAFEAALRLQPENADAMYALAVILEADRQWERSLELLARAARVAPQRADIRKLEAIVATELGALADAAAAWDTYLALAPGDDAARRERALLSAQMGDFAAGSKDLEAYIAKYPKDPIGYCELAAAQRSVDPARALEQLNRAIELDPSYEPARAARGGILYQDNMPEAALIDLETAARLRPEDASNLDRLGQTYQALDRSADALRVLREAARLAPGDGKTQLHLARALADTGHEEESKAAMDRFRQLGSDNRAGVPAGLIDYLALPADERRSSFRVRVERAVREHPEDVAAQFDALKLALEDGRIADAEAAAKRFTALKPAQARRLDAGNAALAAHQYALAKDLLAGLDGAEAERALADFYLAGARPEGVGAVAEAFEKAIVSAPGRRDLRLRAAAFLADYERFSEAAAVLERAARAFSEDRGVLLRYAIALERAGQPELADRVLAEVERRWPEWLAVYLARGMILSRRGDTVSANRAFARLGSERPDVNSPELLKKLWNGTLLDSMP